MNSRDIVQKAIAAGVLPSDALSRPTVETAHPWPLVVMSFLGSLLAAVPVVGFFAVFFGDALMREGVTAYLVSITLLVGCGAVLRERGRPLFVECLSLVFLLAGLALLFFALTRDLHSVGYLVCGVLALTMAALIPVRWIRALLGVVAAAVLHGVLADGGWHLPRLGFSLVLVLLWLVGLRWQKRLMDAASSLTYVIGLEWVLSGWIVTILVAIVALPELGFFLRGYPLNPMLLRSIALAVAAAGVLLVLMRLPTLRSPGGIGLGCVLIALTWFMPSLGIVTFVGAVALTTDRLGLATLAALGNLWVIGKFYYVLQWDLVTKAQILLVAGVVLLLLVGWQRIAQRRPRAPAESVAETRVTAESGRRYWACGMIALGIVGTLAVINVAIWQKERLIAQGVPVFIRLAPVDPRSLMQGDYMALNFEMSSELRGDLYDQSRLSRPRVAGPVDAHGVVMLQRLADKAAPGEVLIELAPGKRGWVVVTDAWFFKEGDGARWSKARYGEFRVLPNGKALLVGMADEALRPILP